MPSLVRKQAEQLREALAKNLQLDFFENGEIRGVFDEIDSLDPALKQKTLALCLSLSHASSAFVFSTLKRIKKAVLILTRKDMDKWLTRAFDLLDAKGIDPFIAFLSKADDDEELRRFQSPAGIRLHSVIAKLEAYIQGISGLGLKIAQGRAPHTDTATIYLPATVSFYEAPDDNFLVYKLMAVHQWARIACGTLVPDEDTIRSAIRKNTNHPDIESVFRVFPERDLALDIFNILEAFRIDDFLAGELPGLVRKADGLKAKIFGERPSLETLTGKTAAVEGIYQHYLKGEIKGIMPEGLIRLPSYAESLGKARTSSVAFKLLFDVYETVSRLDGEYVPREPLFLGTIRPEKVSRLLRSKRMERKKKYEGIINKILSVPEHEPQARPLLPKKEAEEKKIDPSEEYIVIKGRIIELDSELRDILEERRGIPGGILVKGSDLGVGSSITLSDLAAEEEIAEAAAGGIAYDEWDFHRLGYKKHWCSLYERDIYPGHEPFVEMTLKRYGAYVRLLRNKFELLKREPKILRRQKDGDDIDIDATVEAFADMRAGLAPAEDLFVRLDRQERNIAVLFLLDMSGSTKGWVNEAEKESLVLMCEALDTLGDNYSIYGFSGMTRTKCDYYRIKGFDEAYSEMIKKRIAGIAPKDYTRMGPAIRHSMELLKSVEARTRLLIILSDGKPEDWDAYKGEYAIEDTRKALIEARERGLHPFCITIDKEARSYLPHMYGEANYILIDDVKKLPNKITDIYRRITT
jgi:nitric oxide reductase NorD protein